MKDKITKFFSIFWPPSFSSNIEREVYQSLVDQSFYKALITIWTSIAVTLLVYIALLFYKHDWKIHLWIALFIFLYTIKLFFYYLYFKSNYLSDELKKKRFSSIHIVTWGVLTGLLCLFLFFIVINGYPLESQIISILAIILFTSGAQSRYTLLPLWYFSYIMVLCVPICIWLSFQGGGFPFSRALYYFLRHLYFNCCFFLFSNLL